MNREALRAEIREKTELSFSRSAGPGGQNVNKRDTKVTGKLPIDLLESPGEAGRERLKKNLAARLSGNNTLVMHSQLTRSQKRNREDILQRMETLVFHALRPPARTRKPTRPGKSAREKRLAQKKRRALIKSGRQRPSDID